MNVAKFMMISAAVMLSPLLARADDLAVNGNPYTPIVTRNVFGLLPIPVVDPNAVPTDVPPPPKITPNGIMTIFGSKEALYKVAGVAKPGKPPEDQSYELGEGESQDDIEVVKIDDQADVITFNNHGTIQELPLSAAPDLSTPSAPTAGPGIPVPTPGFRRFPRPGMPAPPPRHLENASQDPNSFMANLDPNSTASGGGSSPNQPLSPADTQGLSPEAQMILMEAQRADWQSKPDTSPNPMIIPPTPLTDQNTPGGGTPEPTGPGMP